MPAGCEFICKNRSCVHYDTGFTITDPWPMGRIELVLNAPNVKKYEDLYRGLIALKNSGRKYACITYPNIGLIEKVAYRVNKWSDVAKCIWQFDVVIENPEDTMQTTVNNATLPTICSKTGCELWDFYTTTNKGINCPHCGIPMHQDRWFTNEE